MHILCGSLYHTIISYMCTMRHSAEMTTSKKKWQNSKQEIVPEPESFSELTLLRIVLTRRVLLIGIKIVKVCYSFSFGSFGSFTFDSSSAHNLVESYTGHFYRTKPGYFITRDVDRKAVIFLLLWKCFCVSVSVFSNFSPYSNKNEKTKIIWS